MNPEKPIINPGAGWVDGAKNFILEKFLRSKRNELENFKELELAKEQAGGKRGSLRARLEDVRLNLRKVEVQLQSVQATDIALSIFRSSVSTSKPLIAVSNELCGWELLIKNAPEILRLARADVDAAEAELETFEKENKLILAELDREHAAAAAEFQRQAHAEQAQARARRTDDTSSSNYGGDF